VIDLPSDASNEVAPNLFVGRRPVPGSRTDVDTIVLTAMEYQLPASSFPGVEVLHVPLDDDPRRPMRAEEIEGAIVTGQRVARRLRMGKRVLSTCAMGLNRSALVAGLAMSAAYGMGADEIVERIRRARGAWALSNPHFVQLLRVVIDERRDHAA
jgi:protein-tyrosine phosphatase